VAETPDGNFVYAWTKGRCLDNNCNTYVSEIEYALLDRYGNTVRPVSKLTDHTGATMDTYDYPAVAVAPNGRIGVLWYRYLWNGSTGKSNYNIWFAILDASGNRVYGPVNLTNNNAWGTWSDLNVPRFLLPAHRCHRRQPLCAGVAAKLLWPADRQLHQLLFRGRPLLHRAGYWRGRDQTGN
jgi:hypothetical protein